MRFPNAWASIARENVALKWGVVALSLVAVTLGTVLAFAASAPPIVIERGCVSRELKGSPPAQSEAEIETFVRESLSQRFDSEAVASSAYLSLDELAARERDVRELENRKMRQRVLVNTVKLDGNHVTVDADRLISVGAIRSALVFPLVLTLGTVPRTEANPYGLVLIQVESKAADDSANTQKGGN